MKQHIPQVSGGGILNRLPPKQQTISKRNLSIFAVILIGTLILSDISTCWSKNFANAACKHFINLAYSDEDHIKTYHKHCYRYDAASFHPTFHATSSWKHSITGINRAERQWPDAVRSKAWGLLVTSTGIADCNMVWLYHNLDLPLIYTGKYGGGFESYSDLCSEYRFFVCFWIN